MRRELEIKVFDNEKKKEDEKKKSRKCKSLKSFENLLWNAMKTENSLN